MTPMILSETDDSPLLIAKDYSVHSFRDLLCWFVHSGLLWLSEPSSTAQETHQAGQENEAHRGICFEGRHEALASPRVEPHCE